MTTNTTTTIDAADLKRALAKHVSGDLYVVELASVWSRDGKCVGARVVAVAGPLHRRDLGIEGPLLPSAELFDRLDDWPLDYPEATVDAAWLQAEEEAGRVTYPVGMR